MSGGHGRAHPHAHAHLLADARAVRSRAGLRAAGLALLVLVLTALGQAAVYVLSGSVALLADLIHNAGDALTALPVGAAFALRSARAERYAGVAVVGAIVISGAVAAAEAIERLVDPREPDRLATLAAAGFVGFAGNWLAAGIRTRAGRRLDSAALVADGQHARADALVSLGVVASAGCVAAGFAVADPLIGLAITALIAGIAYESWRTVRAA